MSATPRGPDHGPTRGAPVGALMGAPPREFTGAEVNGLISRVTGLAAELPEVVRFAGNMLGTINSNPVLRAGGLESAAIMSVIAQHMPRELLDRMDPTKRADIENRRTAEMNPTGVVRDAFGRIVQGNLLAMAGQREAGDERTGGSATYARNLSTQADSAFLRSIGLTDSVGRGLASLGFRTPEQVRQLVNDSTKLGLDPNKGALPLAHLKKANPANYNDHVNYLNTTFRKGEEELNKLDEQISRETDPGKKAALQKKREEVQKQHEENKRTQRAKTKTPEERKRLEGIEKLMRENLRRKRELGPQAERKTTDKEVTAETPQRIQQAQEQRVLRTEQRTDTRRLALRSTLRDDEEDPTSPSKVAATPSPSNTPSATATPESPAAGPAKTPEQKTASTDPAAKKGKEPEPNGTQVQARSTKAPAGPSIA